MQSPIVQSYPACSDTSTSAICWSSRSSWRNGSASPATASACTRTQPNAACWRLRIDKHARRLVVREGPAEDVVALGWQLDGDAALQLALERLRAKGIRCAGERRRGSGDARRRAVLGLRRAEASALRAVHAAVCSDAARSTCRPAASSLARRAWAISRSRRASRRRCSSFFQDVFDARVSDTIEDRLNGVDLELTFLRLNARHHTIAIAATRGKRMDPIRTGSTT